MHLPSPCFPSFSSGWSVHDEEHAEVPLAGAATELADWLPACKIYKRVFKFHSCITVDLLAIQDI